VANFIYEYLHIFFLPSPNEIHFFFFSNGITSYHIIPTPKF